MHVLTPGALVDLHTGLGGQLAERLRERQAVALHDEAEDVSTQPAAKDLQPLAHGVTTNDGVFSPWKGHSPLNIVPAFFSVTVSPTTSTIDSLPLTSAATPTAKYRPPVRHRPSAEGSPQCRT